MGNYRVRLSTFDSASVAAPAIPATLDPNQVYRATLSNGNLKLTANYMLYPRKPGVSITTSSKNSGKYYWEITIPATNSWQTWIGYGEASKTAQQLAVTAPTPTTADDALSVYLETFAAIAVDVTNGKLWIRKQNGTWTTGNPETGTSPHLTFTPGLSIRAAIGCYGEYQAGYIDQHDAATVNFGQSAFVYTPPTGFGIWTE